MQDAFFLKANAIQNDVADSSQMDDQCLGNPPRLRFWEIDRFFKCPVPGMCLTNSEQKHLLKKAGFSLKKKSLFEIHETLVVSSDSENPLSRKVDNLLNRKFNHEAASLFGLGEKEFKRHLRTCFEAGEFGGSLWAAATRPDLSIECRREIFGVVHMAMHSHAGKSGKFKKKLACEQEKSSEMRREAGKEVRARRALRKDNAKLMHEREELRVELIFAEKENARLESEIAGSKDRLLFAGFKQENDRLKADLNALSGKVKKNDNQTAFLKEQNRRLSAELDRQKESSARFKKQTQGIIRDFFDLNRCDASCPAFDLCKKRILLVGGMTRMESLYRQLIEKGGGIFEYHDGYMQRGVKRLENSLRRADVVLCPVNCNSHAACSLVKNLGKKHNKPVRMLAGAGLSAVFRSIWGDGAVAPPAVDGLSEGIGVGPIKLTAKVNECLLKNGISGRTSLAVGS
ncbi:MAG: DUF2325 domain-containing protein [Thermodesulfobacteriota bacterium]|nr:DUF2325 domain-containing protein [Thermodesulfobacteriota bacterium]